MAYDSLLINTCNIISFTEDGTFDIYRQPNKSWDIKVVDGVTYEGLPCRHISGKGREIKIGQEVHLIYDQLFVEDIDITVQDRVIIDPLGAPKTYQIIDVLFRQDGVGSHHKEAYLEIVQ